MFLEPCGQGKGGDNGAGCLDRVFFLKDPPPLICPTVRVQVPQSIPDSEAIPRTAGACTLNYKGANRRKYGGPFPLKNLQTTAFLSLKNSNSNLTLN